MSSEDATKTTTHTALHIRGWDELYEVDAHGRAAIATTKAYREGPLDFVRLRVAGHAYAQGPAYRHLRQRCGSALGLMHAYATFCKLLELAACQPRARRGWILTHD